tara:strand:- start:382 stop:723 length:342 start_codon:yes stop_codon:yes gene_type:complete
MLKTLTQNYIDAFNSKNLKRISEFLTDDFVLEDPVVKRIEGKDKALSAINNIFTSCNNLEFTKRNIYQDNQTTFIEFILKLDDTVLTGIDIIEWENNKMTELRAYLDVPSAEN